MPHILPPNHKEMSCEVPTKAFAVSWQSSSFLFEDPCTVDLRTTPGNLNPNTSDLFFLNWKPPMVHNYRWMVPCTALPQSISYSPPDPPWDQGAESSVALIARPCRRGEFASQTPELWNLWDDELFWAYLGCSWDYFWALLKMAKPESGRWRIPRW